MLTGRDGWEAVWSRIAAVVEDGPDNANNRFDAAAVLNAAFPGDGPFWGNGLKRDIPGLPRRKPGPAGERICPATGATPNRRSGARRRSGSSSGRGRSAGRRSPGSRPFRACASRTGAAVWPFETLGEGRAHVLAEIYPSLIEPAPGPEVKDARQVKCGGRRPPAGWTRTGRSPATSPLPRNLPPEVREEEATILGMHDPAELQAAARTSLVRGG